VLPVFLAGRKVLSVAGSSLVKQVAGSIAHTSREGEAPVLSAVGPASVNQAVKAIAIARKYLESDRIDLRVEVLRAEAGNDIKDLILLNLRIVPAQGVVADAAASEVAADATEEDLEDGEYQNLKSGQGRTSLLAGAIAKNVRENNRVRITAVGQNRVFRAVDAVVSARRFLAEDSLDLEFQPEFTHVTFANGAEANAVQLIVLPHQL
jgi:stage V sporulation protein S